jgi:hypothetical protein
MPLVSEIDADGFAVSCFAHPKPIIVKVVIKRRGGKIRQKDLSEIFAER